MEKSKRSFLPWGMVPTILTLAWPTMLEELMQTAVQYIDTAMVGAIGTQATAAVGATSTVNWLIGSTVAAIGVGFLSFVSRTMRGGGYETGGESLVSGGAGGSGLRHVFYWADAGAERQGAGVDAGRSGHSGLGCPILFHSVYAHAGAGGHYDFRYAASFGRGYQDPMRVGFLVNGVNVILNFLLIYPTRAVWGVTVFGAGWGVIGAAVASAISFVIGGVCITVVLWRHPLLSPKEQKLRPDWDVLKPCLRVALPNALQRFVTSWASVAFASMINSLGEITTPPTRSPTRWNPRFTFPGTECRPRRRRWRATLWGRGTTGGSRSWGG